MSDHVTSELMHRYVDGEIPWQERERVRAHVASCSACQQQLASLRQAEHALRQMAGFPVPTDFTAQVMTRVRSADSAAPWTRATFTWMAHGFVTAGLFVLAAALLEVVTEGIDIASLLTENIPSLVASGGVFADPLLLSTILPPLANTAGTGLATLEQTSVPVGVALLALGGFLEIMRWLATGVSQAGGPM